MSRLWILDPGFKSVAGHHYELNRALVSDCRRRGLEVRIAAHREIHGEAASLPVDRVFSHTIYDEVYQPDLFDRIRRRSHEDFAALPYKRFEPDDTLLLHSVFVAHLLAISDWFNGLPAAGRPRCVVLHTVGWFGGEWTQGAFEWSAEFRGAAARLAAAAGRRGVTFAAVNEPLRQDWEAHAGVPASLHPIPCPVIAEPRARTVEEGAAASAALRFAFLGGGRTEKGFDLLPDLVPLLARSCPQAEILIQVAPIPGTSPAVIASLRALAGSNPSLQLYWGDATSAEYRRLLGAADIVLHPYDPVRYRARGSGVFFEAMASGLPMVLPSSTWMAAEWERSHAGGALFDDWNVAAVAAAAAEVAKGYEHHLALSRAAAERWRAKHSVAAFLDFVLQSASPPVEEPSPPPSR